MATSMTTAVDLAKTVFEIAVSDGKGKALERQHLSRGQFQRLFKNREPASVVMEDCGGFVPNGWPVQRWALTICEDCPGNAQRNRAALEWRRSRNVKAVAVAGMVRQGSRS